MEPTRQRIYDFVRALTRPYPGAFTYLRRTETDDLARGAIARHRRRGAGHDRRTVRGRHARVCGQVGACQGGQLLLLEVEDAAGRVLVGHELCQQPWTNKGCRL